MDDDKFLIGNSIFNLVFFSAIYYFGGFEPTILILVFACVQWGARINRNLEKDKK